MFCARLKKNEINTIDVLYRSFIKGLYRGFVLFFLFFQVLCFAQLFVQGDDVLTISEGAKIVAISQDKEKIIYDESNGFSQDSIVKKERISEVKPKIEQLAIKDSELIVKIKREFKEKQEKGSLYQYCSLENRFQFSSKKSHDIIGIRILSHNDDLLFPNSTTELLHHVFEQVSNTKINNEPQFYNFGLHYFFSVRPPPII